MMLAREVGIFFMILIFSFFSRLVPHQRMRRLISIERSEARLCDLQEVSESFDDEAYLMR